MEYAPIIIFAYNRPHHTRQLLQSLKENAESALSDIYVFIDGLKSGAGEDQKEKREEVIGLVKEINWCRNLNLKISEVNKGLAQSVMEGVSAVLEKNEKVIVLEDDLVCDRYFLSFMNQALDLYANDEQVACVSGYIYPLKENLPQSFFIRGADCWGWATWRRAWKIFDSDAGKLLDEIKAKKLESEFNFNNSYPYLQMLEDKKENRNSSWAVLWYASAFVKNKLCLYPGHSLIQNTGNDASGTHSQSSDIFHVDLKNEPIHLGKIPAEVNERAFEMVSHFFAVNFSEKVQEDNLVRRIYRKLVPESFRKWLYDWRQDEKEDAGWSGNYSSWREAAMDCSGYDAENIFEKVKEASLVVKSGGAVFERDSVLFKEEEYNEDFLKTLNLVTSEGGGNLRVLDFGGSLGSVYFQYRKKLRDFKNVKWCVVEQRHFVEFGKKELQNDQLKFYGTIEECLSNEKIDVVLLSSVLSYLEDPWQLLEKILKTKAKFVVIDRQLFLAGSDDIITKQVVPAEIYKASYPCRIFSRDKMVKFISGAYELVKEFDPYGGMKINIGNRTAHFAALVLKKK